MSRAAGALAVPLLPARRDRGVLVGAVAAVCFVAGFATATIAGVPDDVLSSVFTFAIVLVPLAAWWAFANAPADIRMLTGFLACASTLWLAGSLDWYYHFVAAGGTVPQPAGTWVVLFLCAYLLAGVGTYRTLRRAISLRRAALSGSIVGAAGIAFGAAVAGHGFEEGLNGQSAVAVLQALGGVAVLTLLASAALASRTTLPLSVLLFGLGQVLITIGFVVYSYDAVGSPPLDVRWPQVAWLGAVVVSILTAAVVALGVDRPIRLTRSAASPGRPVDARAVLYSVFGALAVSVGVAVYGQAAGEEAVLWAGLGASAWIGAAAALRTSGALASLEHTSDRLAEANERLLELDRLKDDLLSSVSHDLRTPLLSISGFAELLLDDAARLTPDERRRFLSAVDRNSVRMLRMVDDLLLAARLRSGGLELEPAPTDLAAEARSCVETLAPLARTRRIRLRVAASDPVIVVVDRARIEQALDNLVSNAVKFAPPGADVEVRVRPDGDAAVVEVADSGPGIAEADLARVFDPFFRSSAAVQATPGIGLGLHLVKAIVEAHRGSVAVETEQGVGTTFRIRLPAT